MNLIIFCIYITLVHSVSHKFKTTYDGINRKVIVRIQEFFAETTLDEQQIYQYDSDTGKLIFKQDWMRQFASGHRWEKYNEIREQVQQIYKINITLVMQQFNQSHGVHRYQRRYGCVWDDKTEVSDGFDDYSYDGHRFISLDLKEGRYAAHVPQAEPTVMKWNNDRKQLDFLKQYYKHECIDWLKELLNFSKATFKKTGEVSELSGQSVTEPIQKNLTEDDTERSAYFISAAIIILAILISIAAYVFWNNWNKLKDYYKKVIHYKGVDSSSPVEGAPLTPQPHPTTESFDKDQDTSTDS